MPGKKSQRAAAPVVTATSAGLALMRVADGQRIVPRSLRTRSRAAKWVDVLRMRGHRAAT